MADDLKILIEANGQIKALTKRLQRWLGKRTGLWQLVPTAENLLIFGRMGPDPRSATQTGDLLLTGNVAAMGGITDIITFLNSTKRSGALVVLFDEQKKTLFFTDGDVRMATSSDEEDRIGALLFRFGMVSEEQLAEALERQSGKHRLGRVLIDMGVITAHDLYTIIRRQVEEIFYSVLMIRSGVFYFYTILEEERLPAQINLDTQNLLLQGVQRMDEMSYFRERIPSNTAIIEARSDVTPKNLGDRERKVYDLVDGMTSVEEIARLSRLGEFVTTKVIFNLMQRGCVSRRRDTDITRLPLAEKKQAKPSAFSALVDTFNEVYRKIGTDVQQKGREPSFRQSLQSFFDGETGFVDLFHGVVLADDGALPTTLVLDNLGRVNPENKMDYLYNGLNELLYFEMFTAGEALPHDDEEALQKRINEIFRSK